MRLENVKELIEARADINATEEDGNTALHLACMVGCDPESRDFVVVKFHLP
ncbi:MAG: hypothetical protein WBIAU2_11600 [Wolbachia endosymbiont of Drosophila biauraria]|nr:MAG: hypothetical protein WBIAU2_09190 [Wolbachia endosymbiont of Drosophila biauraria]BEP32933.1 MAG: hypothetical protein WBIAU2_11600 [Wolbachia endosymbiont of Drosophila biauraria]